MFITSKLAPGEHGEERVYEACIESLERLRVSYLDLYLMHWPGVKGWAVDDPSQREMRLGRWRAFQVRLSLAHEVLSFDFFLLLHLRQVVLFTMGTPWQRLYREGKCRAIGVSNFTPAHLTELIESADCEEVPHVNQFELHPFLQQRPIIDACKDHGIVVQAYSPLARADPRAMEHPVVQRVCTTHGCTPAQALLAWGLARGFVVLPKSITPARVEENAEAIMMTLSEEEVAEMDGLECDLRQAWNPWPVA